MPQLELTELEAKVLWLIIDHHVDEWESTEERQAENNLWRKVYRAYRGMPPKVA